MAIFASSNLAFCSEMYLWDRSHSRTCLVITELRQGWKDYQHFRTKWCSYWEAV